MKLQPRVKHLYHAVWQAADRRHPVQFRYPCQTLAHAKSMRDELLKTYRNQGRSWIETRDGTRIFEGVLEDDILVEEPERTAAPMAEPKET